MSDLPPFRWAPRVEQEKIRRLYETDARGIVDEELIDDVGYAMLGRCESILIATRAHAGDVMCKQCRANIKRDIYQRDATLVCEACGWASTWREYHQSYRHKQLVGGLALPAFIAFTERWPLARTPRDKLLAIDAVVHACHMSLEHEIASRPAAVNLIQGTSPDLLHLLNEIAYSDLSTPGLDATRDQWRRRLENGARWWAKRQSQKPKQRS
jgi:hypothetical protein